LGRRFIEAVDLFCSHQSPYRAFAKSNIDTTGCLEGKSVVRIKWENTTSKSWEESVCSKVSDDIECILRKIGHTKQCVGM
jgi:hypothetical protein